MDLEESSAIEPDSDPLADDLRRVNEVVENRVVHSQQRARPRAFLLQLVHFSRRLGQHTALGNEHHVATGELLLQLADQTCLDLRNEESRFNQSLDVTQLLLVLHRLHDRLWSC